MDKGKKRIAISLDGRQLKDVDKLKQSAFYNKNYSDLFKYLIDLGIEVARERGQL